jgi:ABC-type transport system involved in multi-copper enzyme maturation permease subunit
MHADRSSAFLIRGLVAIALVAVFICTANLDRMSPPPPGWGVYAWLQGIAAVALAAAFVLAIAARAGTGALDLLLPAALSVAGASLQAASAWAIPTAAAPGSRPGPATAPASIDPLVQGAATAALMAALLVHEWRRRRAAAPTAPLRARLRAALRSLTVDPASLLFGPVFQKEVRVAGRHRATYAARLLVPLILTGVVGAAYAGMTQDLRAYSGAQRLQRLQSLAPAMAMVMAWAQFGLLLFIAPVLTSSAICDERRARTLPALLTTPLTSAQIVGGKMAGRLVQVVILALVGAPLLLGIRVYGGLEARVIVATTAVTLSASLLGAALGLMFSIWHRRAAPAAIYAILSMVALTLVPVAIITAITVRSPGPPASLSILLALSPPIAMGGITAAVFEGGGGGPGSILHLDTIWVTSSALSLGLAALVVLFSTALLRRVLRAEAAGAMTEPRPRRRRSAARPAPSDGATAVVAGPRRGGRGPRGGGEVGDRPVLWREFRQSAFGSRRFFYALAAVASIALAWLYWSHGFFQGNASYLHATVAIVVVLGLCAQASLACTGAISGERDARTWDVLLTTPLTPAEIVLGKFAGGLRRTWFAFAVLAFHCALCLVIGAIHPLTVAHLFLIALGAATFLCGTGLLLSMLLRRGAAAAVVNMALGLALWFVLPIAVVLAGEMFDYRPGDTRWALDAAFTINPVAMAAAATAEVSPPRPSSFPPLRYDMPGGTLGPTAFTAHVCVGAFLGTAVGIGAVFIAIARFHRAAGRAS